jgi:predicted MFS family arabinose efflux permease
MGRSRDALWSPLRNRGYRRLWLGQTMSDFANWLDMIALGAVIVYTWGYGPMAMAWLSVCIGVPWVAIGPLMSVLSRRLPGKRVLVVCDVLRSLVLMGLIWAPNLEVLLVLVFLKMSISSVFDPVRQSAVKRLVDEEELAQASGLSQMSVNLTKIAAPAVGGLLFGWLGGWAPFAIGAALYAVSALVLGRLPSWGKDAAAAKKSGDSGMLRELRGSWDHIASRPLLKAALLYIAAIFFLIFLYDGLIVVLAQEAGMSESLYGMMIGAVGAGSVAGAAASGCFRGWRKRPLAMMSAAGAVAGLLVALLGAGAAGYVPTPMWLWLPLCALLGFVGSLNATPFGYILQRETTEETIGPVSALSNALQAGSMLIAPVLGAIAASRLSAGMVFVAAGILMAALALLFRGASSAGVSAPASSGQAPGPEAA